MIVNFFNLPKAFGYITVESRGGFFEKILETAAKKGHLIWNIRKDKNKILFNAEIKSYRFLRQVARKNQCRIRIAKKCGIYFRIKEIRNVKRLPFGIASFFITLYVLGGYIFSININGEIPFERSVFFDILEQASVTYFAPISDIDAGAAKQTILINANEFSFVAINLSYGKAEIELRTQKERQEVDEGTFGNLVAKRDAVIYSIDTNSGKAVVSPKDVVKKGELLIEQADVKNENSWVQGTIAEVIGTTDHRFEVRISKNKTISSETGNESTSYFIDFNGQIITLKDHSPNINLFETTNEKKQVIIFGCELPIYFVKQQNFEVTNEQKSRTSVEIEQILEDFIEQYLEGNTTKSEIIDKQIEQKDDKNSYIYHVTLKLRESIGVSVWQVDEN